MRILQTGTNRMLGALVCASCEEHHRCAYDDKHIWLDDDYYLAVFANGKLELCSEHSRDTELEQLLIDHLASSENVSTQPFGDGIGVFLMHKMLECSSCGCQEFQALNDTRAH